MQLYKLFSEKGLNPHTELTLKGYKGILREVARTYGYIPHNGHGFVNTKYVSDKDKNITSDYVFEYHKCVMGYENGDVIGFGAGAESGFFNYVMLNEKNIIKYVNDINKGTIPTKIYRTDYAANYARGVISHLPYFGYAEKKYINIENVPNETKEALQDLINVGLVIETEQEYRITSDAWLWDNEIMYYLSPNSAKDELDACFTCNLSDTYYKITN